MSNITFKNNQNIFIETVDEDGAITIVTEKSIPKYLTTSVNINVENVIGRDEDLSKVIQLLAYSKKVVLVNGLGGIGKTTLAKVLFTEQQKHYQHIAWINVTGDLKEAFVFNTVLLQNLCIDVEDIPRNDDFINHVFEVIINRLQQLKGNNLLVIDNAQEDIGITQNIDFITLEDNWNVLITSRQHLEGFEIYELGFLEEHHALMLFYLHYHIEKDDELVKQILQAVDFHTLAIEVLAKTGQAKKLSLKNIIKELEAKGLSLTTKADIKLNYTQKKRIQNIYAFILAAFEIADLTTYQQWILMQFSVLPSLYISYQGNDGENILEFLQIDNGLQRDVFSDAINNLDFRQKAKGIKKAAKL